MLKSADTDSVSTAVPVRPLLFAVGLGSGIVAAVVLPGSVLFILFSKIQGHLARTASGPVPLQAGDSPNTWNNHITTKLGALTVCNEIPYAKPSRRKRARPRFI